MKDLRVQSYQSKHTYAQHSNWSIGRVQQAEADTHTWYSTSCTLIHTAVLSRSDGYTWRAENTCKAVAKCLWEAKVIATIIQATNVMLPSLLPP